jgi:hypothetical protein
MNSIFRILNNQFELNDSMRNYTEHSYIKPETKQDEKGKYKEKVSYSSYNGETEYPDNGIVGHRVEKIYEECKHEELYVFGSWYKCKQCNEFILK